MLTLIWSAIMHTKCIAVLLLYFLALLLSFKQLFSFKSHYWMSKIHFQNKVSSQGLRYEAQNDNDPVGWYTDGIKSSVFHCWQVWIFQNINKLTFNQLIDYITHLNAVIESSHLEKSSEWCEKNVTAYNLNALVTVWHIYFYCRCFNVNSFVSV